MGRSYHEGTRNGEVPGADGIEATDTEYAMDPTSDVVLMNCFCYACQHEFTLQYELAAAYDGYRMIAEIEN